MNIYNRFVVYGCRFDCKCSDITVERYDELMQGASRAARLKVVEAAFYAGVIDQEERRREKNPRYNSSRHFKTLTHLVYIALDSTTYFLYVPDSSDRCPRKIPHRSHNMTDWKSTIVTLISTSRFGELRECRNCGGEHAFTVAGEAMHVELTRPCQE